MPRSIIVCEIAVLGESVGFAFSHLALPRGLVATRLSYYSKPPQHSLVLIKVVVLCVWVLHADAPAANPRFLLCARNVALWWLITYMINNCSLCTALSQLKASTTLSKSFNSAKCFAKSVLNIRVDRCPYKLLFSSSVNVPKILLRSK